MIRTAIIQQSIKIVFFLNNKIKFKKSEHDEPQIEYQNEIRDSRYKPKV